MRISIQEQPIPSFIATLLTFIMALAFLRLMDFIAHRDWIDSKTSHKLTHIDTGPYLYSEIEQDFKRPK